MTDLLKLDASALLDGYANAKFSPVDVVEALELAIARLEPVLNAYSARNPALLAEAEASAARWRTRMPLGTLDGVPLVVKDNLAAAGMAAAWGNAALAKRPIIADELPVARLKAAGALVVGKGNSPEFAVEGYTGNLTFGVTGNPFDPALTPGGSSGGVVTALAGGMAHVGVGTDGGGSIRRPSAYCGLFGLKPGIGDVPRFGGLAQVLLDFEVVGPIARSMRDLTLMDQAVSGPDPRDPRSLPDQRPSAWPTAPRVLYVPRLGDAPCDQEILSSAAGVAEALTNLGCAVTEGILPLDLTALNAAWSQIGEIGLALMFQRDPEVGSTAAAKYQEMADRGAAAPATQLWALLDMVDQIRRDAAQVFQQCDIILTPSCAAMPWPAADAFPTEIDGQAVGPRGHAIYTGWVNAAGLPALQLPAKPAPSGLPIGVQLIGAMGTERRLLALGTRYENAEGGFVWPANL